MSVEQNYEKVVRSLLPLNMKDPNDIICGYLFIDESDGCYIQDKTGYCMFIPTSHYQFGNYDRVKHNITKFVETNKPHLHGIDNDTCLPCGKWLDITFDEKSDDNDIYAFDDKTRVSMEPEYRKPELDNIIHFESNSTIYEFWIGDLTLIDLKTNKVVYQAVGGDSLYDSLKHTYHYDRKDNKLYIVSHDDYCGADFTDLVPEKSLLSKFICHSIVEEVKCGNISIWMLELNKDNGKNISPKEAGKIPILECNYDTLILEPTNIPNISVSVCGDLNSDDTIMIFLTNTITECGHDFMVHIKHVSYIANRLTDLVIVKHNHAIIINYKALLDLIGPL